jgi:hypothetical protein
VLWSVLDVSCKLLGCTSDSVAVLVVGAAEKGPFDADATVPSAATTRNAAPIVIDLMSFFMLTPPSSISVSFLSPHGLSLKPAKWQRQGRLTTWRLIKNWGFDVLDPEGDPLSRCPH